MPSIWELIAERETAAAAAAQTLREQITTLSAELALVDTELTDLAITRTTLTKLIGGAEATAPADATTASDTYQKILAVFTATTDGMRAKDVCRELGLGICQASRPRTPKASAPSSNASSPARSWSRPSRACSRLPRRRRHSPRADPYVGAKPKRT